MTTFKSNLKLGMLVALISLSASAITHATPSSDDTTDGATAACDVQAVHCTTGQCVRQVDANNALTLPSDADAVKTAELILGPDGKPESKGAPDATQ